jgi:hypothetical protein
VASQTTCAVSIQDRSKGERQPIVCPRPGPPMVRAMAGWRPPITRVVCRSDGRTPANRIVIGLPGLSRQPTTAGYVLDPSSRPADLHCIALNGRDGMADAVRSRQVWYVCHGPAGGGGGGRRGRRRRGCPRSTATPGRAAEAGAPSSLFARPCRGSLGSPSPHRLARATVGHGRRPGRCVHCTHTDGSTSGDFVCLVGLGRYSLVPPCEGTGRVAFVEWGLGASFSAVCVSDTYVCIIYTYID